MQNVRSNRIELRRFGQDGSLNATHTDSPLGQLSGSQLKMVQ